MRIIDATNYGDRIRNIMACWNISPCLTDAERTKAVSNLKVAMDVLAEMPTISPDSLVKRGRWILNNDGSGTCDQCRRTQIAVWDFDNVQKYCGHCGALMED